MSFTHNIPSSKRKVKTFRKKRPGAQIDVQKTFSIFFFFCNKIDYFQFFTFQVDCVENENQNRHVFNFSWIEFFFIYFDI